MIKSMNTLKILVGFLIIQLIVSCSPKSSEEAGVSDYEAFDTIVSSSAAVVNKKDSTHKFIRTAELKFKAKSVIKSTYNIEDIATRMGGFVSYTNLSSNINYSNTKAISVDSSLIITHFTVENSMIIRVPNTKLDTTLKLISKNIDFLDYRIIKAEDVALQLLSNNLTIKRSNKNEERITRAIDNRGKKLTETTIAEEVLLSKQEQADNARIANLALKDQLNFSTINLYIYQNQTVKYELIANDTDIKNYEQSFGSKILESLKQGWDILEAVLVFIINLWGLALLAIIIFLLYKLYIVKFKKK